MSSSLRVNTIVPSTGTNVAIGTANGTVTFTDSVNFVLGTGSSIFSPASNTLTFGTNDAERIRITSAGSVAIGVNSPSDKLHVGGNNAFIRVDRDNGNPGLTLMYNSSNSTRGDIDVTTGGDLRFATNSSTERLRITSGGDVGIGDNAPNSNYGTNLSVHSTATDGARLKLSDGTSGKGNTDGFDLISTGGVAYILNRENADMSFSTNNTERLRITSTGDIGIGNDASFPIYTDSTDRNLIVGTGSNDSAIQIHSGTTKYGGVYFGDGTSGASRYYGYVEYKHGDDFLRFATSGTERLRIGSGGNLALGGLNTSAYSGHTNLFLGGIANLYAETTAASTGSLSVSNNAYINSSGNWVYRVNGKASNAYQYDGGYGFRTAGTGSAGGTISWTERFSIDSSGRRKLPYQPAARLTIDSNGTGGSNQAQTGLTILPFNNTNRGYNTGNHFNTTNHTFTAPLDGKYLVILSVNVIGDNIAYIYKNGSIHSAGEFRSNPNGIWEHMEISTVVDCSANDTIQPYSQMTGSGRKFNGGSQPGSYWDTFTIYFLG